MSDTGVYVVVVGHNLIPKCDVANALFNQRERFRSLSCRRRILIKSRKTVNGKELHIVVTPDINTPAWTYQETDIKKFKTKVFLYVQDNGCIDSDDAGSIEILRKTFSEKNERFTVVLVRYNIRTSVSQSCVSLDDSLSEGFSQVQCDSCITINEQDMFAAKSEKARKILTILVEKSSLGKDKGILEKGRFEGSMLVDDKKAKATADVSTNSQVSEINDSILESVSISEAHIKEEEFRNLTLPDLEEGDWTLFRKTLKVGRARSNHVRVNVVGNQGAGKTTLVKRLQEKDIKCPDQNQASTEGIEINQVTTRCSERDGVRKWETESAGYEKELNLQRMAFALQYAEQMDSPLSQIIPQFDVDKKIAELEIGSDSIEEFDQVQTRCAYEEHIDVKRKELYLKKVKQWKDNSKEERMYVSYWDFAGQTTYYSTHQAFMAPSAVYVLVINLSMGLQEKLTDKLKFRTGILKQYTVEETVKFWISSIKAYTRDEQNGHAPFIIVGTHKDKISDEEAREKFGHLRKVLNTLTQVEFIAIDNTLDVASDTHLRSLRDKILHLGLGIRDEEIPAQWINLENIVLQKKDDGKYLLSFADVQEFDAKSDMPMMDPNRIEAFLEHQHRRGWLMHFCHVDLKDIIILDPSLLADYFNAILTERHKYELPSSGLHKDGIVHKTFLNEAAKVVFNVGKSTEYLEIISKILTNLHIMHPYEEDTYFLPCLLPHREDRESLRNSYHCEKASLLKLSFQGAFVPPSFFHLLIAAMNEHKDLSIYKLKDVPRIYNLFACFCFQRETLWLEVYWQDCSVFFELKNYSSQYKIRESIGSNKMIEMMDIVENKIEDILHVYRQDNVQYRFEIECPKHPLMFVDLLKVKTENEVMCSNHSEIHAVSWKEISEICPWRQFSFEDQSGSNEDIPNDKVLGRLAWHLTSESTGALAAKLKLPQGNILADQAISEWEKCRAMQRLRLLCRWKELNPDNSLATLVKMLTKRKDYDAGVLTGELQKQVERYDCYDIDDTVLDYGPAGNEHLVLASDCIGADYAFLMLELGLTVNDIEVKRLENANNLKMTIYKLLVTWRERNNCEATVRTILDTVKYLGMNWTAIASKFKKDNLRVPYKIR